MLRVSTNIDASSHGDVRITKLITGEIHPGSLVLLKGESDTGKSVLCQQVSYNALYNNLGSVAYFTSYSKADDLLDQMESFSFHVHYHFVSDKFRIYSLSLINRNPSIDEAVRLLLDCLDNLPSLFSLVVIDNLNPLLADMSTETQVRLLRDVKSLCRRNLRSVIMVTNPYVFSRDSLSRIYSLCDYHLKADIVTTTPGLEQMDCRTTRSLEVRKICGVEMAAGETVRFEIRPGSGIHILPYVTVRA